MSAVVLFDIDGTLVPQGKSHTAALVAALREVYGVEPDLTGFRPYGLTDRRIVTDLGLKSGVKDPGVDLDRCLQRMEQIFLEMVKTETVSPFDGALAALAKFQEREIFMGLLTGNPKKIAWEKMRKIGAADYFSFGGFGCSHVDRREVAKVAKAEALRLRPQSAGAKFIVIGDTPNDIEAGKAINATTVCVATGRFSRSELAHAGASYTLESIRDIESIRDQLLGPV